MFIREVNYFCFICFHTELVVLYPMNFRNGKNGDPSHSVAAAVVLAVLAIYVCSGYTNAINITIIITLTLELHISMSVLL